MDVAWGEKFGDETSGLDILGVRALDQSMEARLVNGITTISPRARYFTILTWSLGEFFDRERQFAATEFNLNRLHGFVFRIEYLTLLCTALDDRPGDGGAILGVDLFNAPVAALKSGRIVEVPDDGRGAMLNTYFGPCRALGLLGAGEGAEPYRLTPRGAAVWRSRNEAMDSTGCRALLEAASLDRVRLQPAVPLFSLKRLGESGAEARLLGEALTVPWTPNGPAAAQVNANYARFSETLAWLRNARERPIRADALLSEAWRGAAAGDHFDSDTQLAWAEYEGRRRLHYALELLLSAVSDVVQELRTATLDEVVDTWLAAPDLPQELAQAWHGAATAGSLDGGEAVVSVPADLWLLSGPPTGLSNMSPHARALAGFALVVAVSKQGALLRRRGQIQDRHETGERGLAVVDSAGSEPFADTFRALAAVAVDAHLKTTFRKMAAGLGCSLRFFPEGQALRTTGLATGAGRSGPRLGSVIRVLQDANVEGLGAVD